MLIAVTVLVPAAARANLPIDVRYGVGRNRAALKLWKDAEEQLKNGEIENAKRNVDGALASDPTLWPALYTRAKVFVIRHEYQLAVRDASEALRQYPPFIEAALLRASANARLGRYAEALKEINHCIAIHPRSDALGRALTERAWLRATCPDPAYRNGKEAVKDSTKACKLLLWQDEFALEALAAAYAETGDFDSASRSARQALAIKDISVQESKALQSEVALYERHRPLRFSP
jgi:tetratricopeptide (TPR) repeat protein